MTYTLIPIDGIMNLKHVFIKSNRIQKDLCSRSSFNEFYSKQIIKWWQKSITKLDCNGNAIAATSSIEFKDPTKYMSGSLIGC